MILEGSYAFPFSIETPDWLPESVMLKDGSTHLSVMYFLTAQLDPRHVDLYADSHQMVSLC